MKTQQKQEWITPELVAYGDITKLTEIPAKDFGNRYGHKRGRKGRGNHNKGQDWVS